jgi:phage-related protein
MLQFPRLKTGVQAQHPFPKTYEFPVRIFTFLDGKEQRFPAGRGRRSWTVYLGELDEREAADVEAFAKAHFLTLEPFEFTDPVTGRKHGPCRLAGGSLAVEGAGTGRRGTTLVIVEEG